MTNGFLLLLCILFEAIPPLAAPRCVGFTNERRSSHVNADPMMRHCVQADFSNTLQKLSSDNQTDIEQARNSLLGYSEQSPACRKKVIDALMGVMDKPDLDFVLNHSSYLLWREGARILGDMKAIESIDLLISHLDLTSGEFSASMAHQPAVSGLTKLGSLAIPKLKDALLHNTNRKIRLAAALCLTGIGGRGAVSALRQALRSENDQGINHFMRVSLSISGNDSKPRRRTSKRPSFSTEINARRELLSSFVKCN